MNNEFIRIINIFENYLKIKYNKDNKDIIIYKQGEVLSVFYKGEEIIKLYSLLYYSIQKISKFYDNEYKYLRYFNYKNNKIIINCNIKTISCKKTYYSLHKKYNHMGYLINKSYYTLNYVHILLCNYIYYIYNIYIYYNKKKLKKLYKYIYLYIFNYKIIFIIFGLYKL